MISIDNGIDYEFFLQYLQFKNVVDFSSHKSYWGNFPVTKNNLEILYDLHTPNAKLLDLGCGAGNVLRYATNIGYDCTGVEFDKTLTRFLGDYKYLNKDITKLPPEFYKNFNVIYCYQPLKAEFKNYINTIISYLNTGTFLITPYVKLESKKLQFVDLNVYKKI